MEEPAPVSGGSSDPLNDPLETMVKLPRNSGTQLCPANWGGPENILFYCKEKIFQTDTGSPRLLPGVDSAGSPPSSPPPLSGRPLRRVETSHWSRAVLILLSDWLRVWFCYAPKTQIKAPKVPYKGHFLLSQCLYGIEVPSMLRKDQL